MLRPSQVLEKAGRIERHLSSRANTLGYKSFSITDQKVREEREYDSY